MGNRVQNGRKKKIKRKKECKDIFNEKKILAIFQSISDLFRRCKRGFLILPHPNPRTYLISLARGRVPDSEKVILTLSPVAYSSRQTYKQVMFVIYQLHRQ